MILRTKEEASDLVNTAVAVMTSRLGVMISNDETKELLTRDLLMHQRTTELCKNPVLTPCKKAFLGLCWCRNTNLNTTNVQVCAKTKHPECICPFPNAIAN